MPQRRREHITSSPSIDRLNVLFHRERSTAAAALRGDSFPVAPVEGQQFFRTDLEEGFYWDDSRSKWLGQALLSFTAGETASIATQGLQFPGGVVGSSTKGIRPPWDGTVVGASVLYTTSSSGTVNIKQGASTLASLSPTTTTEDNDITLDADFTDSASPLWVEASGFSPNITEIVVLVLYRRTAT